MKVKIEVEREEGEGEIREGLSNIRVYTNVAL